MGDLMSDRLPVSRSGNGATGLGPCLLAGINPQTPVPGSVQQARPLSGIVSWQIGPQRCAGHRPGPYAIKPADNKLVNGPPVDLGTVQHVGTILIRFGVHAASPPLNWDSSHAITSDSR